MTAQSSAAATTNQFRLAELRKSLAPFRLHYFTTLRSTNHHAAVMRRRGQLFAPAVVLTSRQTAGRGRGVNTWFSTRGSLTVTFVLPVGQSLAPHHVPLAAGLAVRSAVSRIAGSQNILLKWPNDLVIARADGRLEKLAGLLCERIEKVDLIGLGLNVNVPRARLPKDLRDRITFLQYLASRADPPEKPAPLDLTQTLIAIAHNLHAALARNADTPFPLLLREYDQHHALLSRRITVFPPHEAPLTGRCEGLDSAGRLLLRIGRQVHRIIAGHVEIRSPK